MNRIIRSLILPFIAVAAGGQLCAQTLTDLGAAAPSPGTNDIYQLSTQGNTAWPNKPDNINYYTDNNPVPGQTFTTGTNAMRLVSVTIKTAGLDSGGGSGTPTNTPTYYLSIYSMSGSTATLLITFSAANPGFTDGDWLKWSGINVPLGTNQTYAYAFGRLPGSGGYAAMAVATNNTYAGGEMALIPISGGTITTGSSHKYDAVFDLGLQPAATNIPASMPLPNPTYGWNLGNTLEATWGVPNFTAAPFYAAASAGFNAVRIPCAWDFNATTNITSNATNYPINPTYMAHVKQAVDWAIAAGMYVVINDHWDDGWLENNIGTTVDPTLNAKMNSYWIQIATTFAGYDNHLLFAGANEPNVNNLAEMDSLMAYYQTFVNAVRGVGGNNTNRWLVLQGGGQTAWLNSLPTDTVSNRLMMEYHCYTPSLFCIFNTDQSWGDAIYFWGLAYHYSGDPTRNADQPEEGAIDSGFQQLTDQYVSKGIPVMVGEFGVIGDSLTNATEAAYNSASGYYWEKYVVDSAHAHGLSPFNWSTPGSLFDWTTGAVNNSQEISVLTGGVASPPPDGAPYAASGLIATLSNNTNVNLSWTAGSGATSYNLYRAAESGGEGTNPVVTGITGTSYTDTNLNSGTTYYYLVAAVNSSGLAGFSPEVHATTTGVNPDPAQFNFETDLQDWAGGGGIISGVATSTTQHFAGRQSLVVNFNGSSSGSSTVYVQNTVVTPGQTITFHVWIPSGSKVTAIQPYMQDYNWTGTSGNYNGSLTANAWNTVTLTVPQTSVVPFQNLAIQFNTSAAWTGTCYVDSISWNTPAPDFSLSANPTSLTVNGGTNGTSVISVTPTNGLNGCYTLTASNLPSGVTATVATNPIAGGASTLTFTVSNSVTSGTSNVTITATCGLIGHTTTIALTLNGNTQPTMAPIANRTVNVGQMVAFTASATDTDQPAQTLTFSLLAGPGTATLNPASGAFSWTPQPGDVGTTNLFTIKVADNGTPSLSATQSFSVMVTLDTNPPVVLRAFNVGTTNVEVDFSKTLETASAESAANYAFANGQPVTSVLFALNGTSVLLGTTPLVYGSNYTVVVNGVRDQAVPPNTVAPNSAASFTASPRQKMLLDANWRFQLGDPVDITTNVTYYPEISDLAKLDLSEVAGSSSETYYETNRVNIFATHAGENVSFVQTNYDDSGWRALNLPHDWAVELPFDSSADQNHGYKPIGNSSYGANNIGWYRHTFTLPAAVAGQALWLEFGGVYRNCLVWLNGHLLGRNVSGYSSFYFDVTPYVNPGGTNVLVVRVDASRFEGWFYEGAGIYRHVWLTTENPVRVAQWGTFVYTSALSGSNATVKIQTEVTNQSSSATSGGTVTSTIYDAASNAVASVTSAISLAAGHGLVATQTMSFAANLWSPQTPYLYKLVTTISNQNAVADIYCTSFGVRTVSVDKNNGIFINGQPVEIKGMCNHQDMAGVGVALPDRLQYFRLERLMQMGVNGYRTSHNEPTEELLDACDQLGMLVLDENRRIGTNAEPMSELIRQIRRDRNHPSIFMWSLGNEESLQGDTANGAPIVQTMQNAVHPMDPTRLCTIAMNGGWGSGFSTVIDVQGFNYYLNNMDSFHSSYPNQPCIGTETASAVGDRGVYATDWGNAYVDSYDDSSSGEPAEQWAPFYLARPWASGAFAWTGFDYRGEPYPFAWPSINSHFGTLDTCGFAKDNFYYYQANWTVKPVLHLLPHWNWAGKEGQPITVWAYGNCQSAELFLNGLSQGRQTLNVQGHLAWSVPYAAGTLQAVGYINNAPVITNTVVTTGVPAAITLTPDRSVISPNGVDVSTITVAAVDSQERVVPTAANLVNFSISGGTIIGVGNGNPNSHEADKASQRSVFNGLAQVIIQSTTQPGAITLTATSPGLTSSPLTLTKAFTLPPPAAPTGVAAVAGNVQVAVSWDIVPGATTYNLWRATSAGGPYTPMTSNIGGVSLGYVDTNVTNQTTYYYVVTANGAWNNGASARSAEVSATPEPAVTGLAAQTTFGQVQLTWSPVVGASYNVKRSLTSGGPYAIIASMVAGTNFTDAAVSGCQSYYYVVTITNGNFKSLPSNEVGPLNVLPPQFSSADIGTVGAAGSAAYCSGQFTITGSGGDIWGNADAFQFVYAYVPVTTNCDIRAHVASVQNTSVSAKAALMIRESLAADSRHAMVDVEPSSSAGMEFIWRSTNSDSSSGASVTGMAPNWIRLTRTNNTFAAYWSADGNAWSQIGSSTNISMTNAAYVGLAVCSHSAGVLNTSVLDNVTATFGRASGAPVLNPVGNQTVNVGQPVSLTATGQDTNSPPFALAFSLLNAPPTASLNQTGTNNAAFYWRPGVPDANSTNQITLKIANNAWPSLSATQIFSVVINSLAPPQVSSAGWSNGQFVLQVNGPAGPDYEIQTSTNLTQWSALFTTNSQAMPFNWQDIAATNAARFYRVVVGPPLP